MRTGTFLVLLLALALAVAVVALVAARPASRAPAQPPPASSVLLVGDSLNVGVEPYLRELLAGWKVEADDEVGRQTATGLERLRAHASSLPPYVVVSLGTNDPDLPGEGFRAAVREALALAGPRRCVVWAALYRADGADEHLNAVLREEARRAATLRVVDWDEIVGADERALAPDGLHGSPAGYRERARATVAALRACYEAGIAR